MRYIGLLAGIGLLLAVTGTAGANTVASSTMYFQETAVGDGWYLTDNLDGTYSGVLPMVDEQTAGIGDGVRGYDVYARNGATAWFGNDPGTGPVWTPQAIANHDAFYPNPQWSPDTPDWYQYSLNLYVDGGQQKWALRNHSGNNADDDPWYDDGDADTQNAHGVPMSGTMDWTNMIATETDVGAYLPATGTPEIPGGAAGKGGGAGYWDMDWSWGSEAVPLQYSTFDVKVESVGGEYRVTMTPIPEPVTMAGLILGIGCLARYVRRRKV